MILDYLRLPEGSAVAFLDLPEQVWARSLQRRPDLLIELLGDIPPDYGSVQVMANGDRVGEAIALPGHRRAPSRDLMDCLEWFRGDVRATALTDHLTDTYRVIAEPPIQGGSSVKPCRVEGKSAVQDRIEGGRRILAHWTFGAKELSAMKKDLDRDRRAEVRYLGVRADGLRLARITLQQRLFPHAIAGRPIRASYTLEFINHGTPEEILGSTGMPADVIAAAQFMQRSR